MNFNRCDVRGGELLQWLEALGREVIRWLARCGEAVILIGQTIKQLPKANWRHVIFQMAHLGVDSLPIISLTLLFAGAVMTLQLPIF